MKAVRLLAAALLSLPSLLAAQDVWPSMAAQLAADKVRPGTALEALVSANQDAALLRADELHDTLSYPLWLRVWWRKLHPASLAYDPADPTKGYPRALHEVREWMVSHQDLKPGPGDAAAGAGERGALAIGVGTNVRASGPSSSPRSESDIRIDFLDPSKVLAASNDISASGRQAQFRSTDGGATWAQTSLPLTGPDAFHSDPAVDWTSDGTAWSMTMGINTNLYVRSYRSTDGGATWTFEGTPSGAQVDTDKELMWVDHSAASPYRDRIYVVWHDGDPAFVNRRTAGAGGTWLASPIQVSGAETVGTAIGADVKTNAAGDAFAFWPATGNRRILVAKSTNGGDSWAPAVITATTYDSFDIGVPSFVGRRALIYVSGGAWRNGARNEVYAAWTDLSGAAGCTVPGNEPGTNAASACTTRVWFARSTDGGATWSAPAKVNEDGGKHDQFNQWLAVDEGTGVIGLMYYDTIADPARFKTDVFFQTSSDGGATWSCAAKVTTAQTDETATGADSGNQYGDYNGLSAFSARFLPSWTDRRSGGREEIWTAAVTAAPGAGCTPQAPAGLYTLAPCRLFDTRNPAGPLGGPALAAGAARTFALAGACGVPADAKALSVNLTAVNPGASGELRLFAADTAAPPTSALGLAAGRTRANNQVVSVSSDGTASVSVRNESTAPTDVLLDVNGFFR